ncbi:MAG: tRNA (adenosine(37)-N6)-threonylcarbamoyltransferase complex dimerization subunit type 1 TsaB [Kineosporiaceae bacterium]
MLLLALDTSTAAVTVALLDDGGACAHLAQLDARRHAELLAPQIVEVLEGCGASVADLTGVAVGVGPGPFTGLRVGITTAAVLAWAAQVPVHGVCSLDAIAQGVLAREGDAAPAELVVATDARRREVYWAPYRLAEHGYVRTAHPAVSAAADVTRSGAPVAGRGAQLYAESLGPALDPLEVDAADLAQVAVRALDGRAPGTLLPLEPLYLRRPDAVEPAGRKRVLQ